MAATTRVRIPVRSYVGRDDCGTIVRVSFARQILRISRRDIRFAFWFMLRPPWAMIGVHVFVFVFRISISATTISCSG